MTARDRFLQELAESRARRRREAAGARGGLARGRRCPSCQRARGWLCEMGRPCVAVPKPARTIGGRSHAARERCRRHWAKRYREMSA